MKTFIALLFFSLSAYGATPAGTQAVSDAILEQSQGSTTSGQKGPLIQAAVTSATPAYTNAQTSPLSQSTDGRLRTQNNALEQAQNSTTSGQTGPLIQGATTTAAPSYTTAKTNPLSLTTAGALRTDSSATTQPVSQANQDLAQGSTTSGQTGPLIQAASTSGIPSYTTAKTNPLSTDLAGNLRTKPPKPTTVTRLTGSNAGAFGNYTITTGYYAVISWCVALNGNSTVTLSVGGTVIAGGPTSGSSAWNLCGTTYGLAGEVISMVAGTAYGNVYVQVSEYPI